MTPVQDSESQVHEAIVTLETGAAWKFRFVPLGWSPTSHNVAAELVFVEDREAPVLVLVDDGILIPQSRAPVRTDSVADG